jgi:hypothetical protein
MKLTYEALRRQVLGQSFIIAYHAAYADFCCFWCFSKWKRGEVVPPHKPDCLYMRLQKEEEEEEESHHAPPQ